MKVSNDIHAFLWSNPTENNCNSFLVDGNKRILIDPGHYHLFGHVKEELSRLSLSIDDIDVVIVTHGHPDHIEGVRQFYGSSTLIAIHHIERDFIRTSAPHYGDALGIQDFEPHILIQEGDLNINGKRFKIIHTPGHSPGSICLYYEDEKALFSGDVVFNQGIGRTDLPSGNGKELKDSILNISGLDIEYLLTGHGDILTGREKVRENFKEIEEMWFRYL